MAKTFYVYILANHARRLYVGVTSDLARRLWWHGAHVDPNSFTSRYRVTKLVYFEHGTSAIDALNREKQIKSWRRDKKVRLIESINAGWHDLGADLLPSHAS